MPDKPRRKPAKPKSATRPTRAPAASADTEDVGDLLRLLVESVTDYAIFLLDDRGFVRTWNPGAERLKGYKESEIVGKHFSKFYTQPDIDAGKPAWELDVAARTGRVEDEGWRLRKDGSRFWANVVITALRDKATGALVGFAKITRDLTERRKAEEQARVLAAETAARHEAERVSQHLAEVTDQLQQQAMELEAQSEEASCLAEELEEANERLQREATEAERARAEAEAANRTKTEFLAVMSHELRTPLNAIAGYAELIRMGLRGPVTAEQLEDLNRITRSERALLSLINDILNFARLEAAKVNFASERVPLRTLLSDIEALVAPQLRAKELRFRVGECDDGVAVQADSDKVRQIVLNLVSNAVKFTLPTGSIDVDCVAENGTARIFVRDTGVGIPEEKLHEVFEPFVQLDRSLTNVGEGSGLGLSISRDLARGMGGDLVAQSAVGVGSTFILSLPVAQPGGAPALNR